MKNSFTEENYLKAIYKLSERDELVTTTDIATMLDIRAATVTDMLKKLAVKKLIRYERYKGLSLTEKGRAIGVKIIRKHRLWELFLVQKMKFRWDEVHEIAEQLEHIQSDELINRLDEMLGFPKADPHGDPIPDKNGVFGKTRTIPLNQVKPKVVSVVAGVIENSNTFLQYLDKIGIAIGDKITIHAIEAYDQSHRISVNQGKEVFISESVAKNILVVGK
ncbi:MAG: metal-dependent transcriptional regulator [Bacteroidia bacterium]|nr:metal-dependent transcriptional regulator [Bacteroidota bacterium]MBK7387496.1 metal-dependent transcriptional regulator [Bacteroidota bacterium]MBK8872765.1 metal-dependent transcriptional regulator [Bacteroidota bacterium]MBP9082812.1 metal-dependent transcriptional regulator [Bacteroidia bacterium]